MHTAPTTFERAPERPVATVAQVYELADVIEPRFRAMVLIAMVPASLLSRRR